MRSFSQSVNGSSGRILILALVVTFSLAVSAQIQPERFWLAGRYDGDRILIYFQAVKFNHTIPQNARRLPDAVVDGFLTKSRSLQTTSRNSRKGRAPRTLCSGTN